MKFTDLFILKLNSPTENGRIYSSDEICACISNKREYYGQLGTIDASTVDDLTLISHKVYNLYIKDDSLYGDMKILSTPRGEILKELMDAGEYPKLWMCGNGKLDTSGNVSSFCIKMINCSI